jgi:hypothetical protein
VNIAKTSSLALLVVASTLLVAKPLCAQDASIRSTFVHLAMNVPAVLYEPVTPGPKAQIALLVAHGADYLTFSACTELSKRGYRVLCENPSGPNLDRSLQEVKSGVDFLRGQPGVSGERSESLLGRPQDPSMSGQSWRTHASGRRRTPGCELGQR